MRSIVTWRPTSWAQIWPSDYSISIRPVVRTRPIVPVIRLISPWSHWSLIRLANNCVSFEIDIRRIGSLFTFFFPGSKLMWRSHSRSSWSKWCWGRKRWILAILLKNIVDWLYRLHWLLHLLVGDLNHRPFFLEFVSNFMVLHFSFFNFYATLVTFNFFRLWLLRLFLHADFKMFIHEQYINVIILANWALSLVKLYLR